MAILHNPRAWPVETHIQGCHHGERLIGHVIERGGKCEARSWPDEVLIGIYTTRDEATAAISDAVDMDPEEFSQHEVVVRPCPELVDRADLFARLQEIIELHRSRETLAIFTYLDDRGIRGDDALMIMSAALQQYADETSE